MPTMLRRYLHTPTTTTPPPTPPTKTTPSTICPYLHLVRLRIHIPCKPLVRMLIFVIVVVSTFVVVIVIVVVIVVGIVTTVVVTTAAIVVIATVVIVAIAAVLVVIAAFTGVLLRIEAINIDLPTIIKGYLSNFGGLWGRILCFL